MTTGSSGSRESEGCSAAGMEETMITVLEDSVSLSTSKRAPACLKVYRDPDGIMHVSVETEGQNIRLQLSQQQFDSFVGDLQRFVSGRVQ